MDKITHFLNAVILGLDQHSGLLQALTAAFVAYITFKFNRTTQVLMREQTVPDVRIINLMLSSSLANQDTKSKLLEYINDNKAREHPGSMPEIRYSLYFQAANLSGAIGSIPYPKVSIRNARNNWRLEFTNVGNTIRGDEFLEFDPKWMPSERLAFYNIQDRLFGRKPSLSLSIGPRQTVGIDAHGEILFDANWKRDISNLMKYFDELVYCFEFKISDSRTVHFEQKASEVAVYF